MYLKSRILSIIIIFAVHVIHAVSESCGFVTIAIFNWSLLMFFFCSNLLGLYLSFSLFICSQQPSLSVHDNQVYHSGHCDHPLLHVRGQCLHVITSYWKMKIIGRKWILALKKCKFFGFCILKINAFLLVFQVLFEKVFLMRPIKALFVRSDDSLHEWRFRWTLDRYVSKHITCRCIPYVWNIYESK